MWRAEWLIDSRWFAGGLRSRKAEAEVQAASLRRMGFLARVTKMGKATGGAR